MTMTKAQKKRIKTLANINRYDVDLYTNHLTRAAKEIGCSVADLLPYLEDVIPPYKVDKNSFLEFFYWNLNWSCMPYSWTPRQVYTRLGGRRN